jgi:hypothetical protein
VLHIGLICDCGNKIVSIPYFTVNGMQKIKVPALPQGWEMDCCPQCYPTPLSDEDRIEKAVEIALNFAGIDGAHHKTWVIDQMMRVLLGDRYGVAVGVTPRYLDGAETLPIWDTGTAP